MDGKTPPQRSEEQERGAIESSASLSTCDQEKNEETEVEDVEDVDSSRTGETCQDGEKNGEAGVDDGDEKEPDMGLRLTCSLRSISRRQYQLENPPDGGLRAWLQGALSLLRFREPSIDTNDSFWWACDGVLHMVSLPSNFIRNLH
jgi:hypothetical protein